MSQAQERRRHPRVRLDGSMVGRAAVLAEFKVTVLSEGGAMLEMAVPLAEGSPCDLTLQLAHGTVELRGRVVHVQDPDQPGAPYRVGVHFMSVEALDQALLKSFLDRELRKDT